MRSLDDDEFRDELRSLLNRHGVDAITHTPDFILADHVIHTLEAWGSALDSTRRWHSWPLSERLHGSILHPRTNDLNNPHFPGAGE